MQRDFQLEEAPKHDWVRLSVLELDLSTALTFRRRLRALRAANTHVSLDLSQLEFIDGDGARAVADAIRESCFGTWRVEIEPNMSGPARRLFDLM